MRRLCPFICVALALSACVVTSVRADEGAPAVHAILFYSQNCPHCHEVITEVLPPLAEQYGEQLQISGADTTTPEGSALYQAAIEHFEIPPERRGVPTLIIGDVVLVGSREIPEQLPGLIEQGLAAGGVDWPAIPGLLPTPTPPATSLATPTVQPTLAPGLELPADARPSVGEIIARDMPGNAISIGILCGMVLCVGYVALDGVRVWRRAKDARRRSAPEPGAARAPAWRDWAVLALCVFGLGVAGYLAYVETTLTEAVCGPVGDCNAVQQSEHARLFGLIPIAVLGVFGYVCILTVWAWGWLGRGRLAELAPVAVLGLTLFGTSFSIYLTFLEPFVVGATCSWCLASAVTMTLLLLLVARPGWEALGREWLSLSARTT
jgi:uncharacterized membrane protein